MGVEPRGLVAARRVVALQAVNPEDAAPRAVVWAVWVATAAARVVEATVAVATVEVDSAVEAPAVAAQVAVALVEVGMALVE